ncbi:MAG: GNAT family N-acetyltransferase [Pseudomonadota bacterium]
MSSDVMLRRMRQSDRPVVLSFRPGPFVDPIADTLSAADPCRDNYVIEFDDVVVGFFQIDHQSNARKLPVDLELHEVQIDKRQQGKGIGKRFVGMLGLFLGRSYPAATGVCLTVNCRNHRAYHLYLRGGFVDTKALHRGGRSGPQHVMVRPL